MTAVENNIFKKEINTFLNPKSPTLRQKKKGETWKIGYFVLTGDQGLAGAYNLNVLNTTEKHIQLKTVDNIQKGLNTSVKLYVAGKLGKERLERNGFAVVEDFAVADCQDFTLIWLFGRSVREHDTRMRFWFPGRDVSR